MEMTWKRMAWYGLVIAGCLLVGTMAWAQKPKTAPVSVEEQLRQKLRNANAQYQNLRQQEAAYPLWQIVGEIRDRDDDGVLIWGTAVSGGVPWGNPGWQTEDGNIYIANPLPDGFRGGAYVAEHYYRGKTTGTNAFGANVPIKVYGDHPNPKLPQLVAAADAKRTDCANKYAAHVYGVYDTRLQKNPKDAALRVEFAGRCLALDQEITGVTCNYQPAVRAKRLYQEAVDLYLEKGIPEQVAKVVALAGSKGVFLDTDKIVTTFVAACPGWGADTAKRSAMLQGAGKLHEQPLQPDEKASLLHIIAEYGRQALPADVSLKTISCALPLGIDVEDVTPVVARYRAPFAVLQVTKIIPSLTEKRTDLQVGDLITACDGTQCASGEALGKAIGKFGIGSTHTLAVVRLGQPLTVTVITGEHLCPTRQCTELGFDFLDISPQLMQRQLQRFCEETGQTVEEIPLLSDEKFKQMGLAIIVRVSPNSLAAQAWVGGGGLITLASLMPGDIITACNGQQFTDGQTLLTMIKPHQPDDSLTLRISREGKLYDIHVSLK